MFSVFLCLRLGRKKDGFRRFREAYSKIPSKNGKSVIGAGSAIYMFAADGESGAKVYSGATTEKQAWEIFRPAEKCIYPLYCI